MQIGGQEVKVNSTMRGGEDFLAFGSVAPGNVWFGICSSSLWEKKWILVPDIFVSHLEAISLIYFPKCCTLYSQKMNIFSVPNYLLGRK